MDNHIHRYLSEQAGTDRLKTKTDHREIVVGKLNRRKCKGVTTEYRQHVPLVNYRHIIYELATMGCLTNFVFIANELLTILISVGILPLK